MKLDKEQSKRNKLASDLKDIKKGLLAVNLDRIGLSVVGVSTVGIGVAAFWDFLSTTLLLNNSEDVNFFMTIINALGAASSVVILKYLKEKLQEKKKEKEYLETLEYGLTDKISKIDMLDKQSEQLSCMLKKGRM